MDFDQQFPFDIELHRWSRRYMLLSVLFIITGIILLLASQILLGFISWLVGQITGYISMKWHKRAHGG